MRRTVAVLTTGRQDWGLLRSSSRAIAENESLDLRLLVGGMHLSDRHGHTVDLIVEDGFRPDVELPWLSHEGETPAYAQAAAALEMVGTALDADTPDVLLLAGDRLETMAAAVAATVARMPIAHLHGGEETEGAFDNQLRHAITKLAHLHLPSSEDHAARLRALGEDPASIRVVGAPGLDGLRRQDLAGRAELEGVLGVRLDPPVVIVSVHPGTLESDPAAAARAVAAAMGQVEATYVVTLPNADPGSEDVRRSLLEAANRERVVVTTALGERRFWGLMRIADAMVGNSSSALVEAPALNLPAVNVGDRQRGRDRHGNVIDVPADAPSVVAGLTKALQPSFRPRVSSAGSSLPDGEVGLRVARMIAAWHPARPPRKPPVRHG